MNASQATASPAAATVDPAEARHFGALAGDWWDPSGASAMLHRLNPVRLRYLREAIDTHFGVDPAGRHPLAGRRALDVGCGAGLLCEPLARMGAAVTGIDAAPELVAAALTHAERAGLAIDYRAGEVAAIEAGRFDLVTAMEVIEHVADRPGFLAALAAKLAPGGLLVMSTPNRTTLSRLLMVGGAEALGLIPRGTHKWDQFLTPDELTRLLADAGLRVTDVRGLAASPTRGFVLGDDLRLNYLLTAVAD